LLLSSAYTKSGTFQLVILPCQQGDWGCTGSWEGTQPGQLTPSGQRDIPYHIMSCSAYISGGEAGQGLLLRNRLGTSRLAMSNCFSFASLVFWWVLFFSLFVVFLLITIYYNFYFILFYFISVIKLFLSHEFSHF